MLSIVGKFVILWLLVAFDIVPRNRARRRAVTWKLGGDPHSFTGRATF